jgi:hypothetical protein
MMRGQIKVFGAATLLVAGAYAANTVETASDRYVAAPDAHRIERTAVSPARALNVE